MTIARAIEMKHSPALISKIAIEIAQTYLGMTSCLKSLGQSKTEKWLEYCKAKNVAYDAYAYVFHGENLVADEKCGEAVKCAQEADKLAKKCLIHCKEYSKIKGPGTAPKWETHPFIGRFKALVTRFKDKCERENAMM